MAKSTKKKDKKQRWTIGELMEAFGITRRRVEYLLESRKIEPIDFERQNQRIFDRDAFRQLRKIIKKIEAS